MVALLFTIWSIILFPAVSAATSLSFSSLNLDPETLLFYNSTGDLVGVYNTSTKAITLDPNTSYSILVQPEGSNLMQNHPETWFSNWLTFMQAHSIAIVVVCFLIFMVATAVAMWRRRM